MLKNSKTDVINFRHRPNFLGGRRTRDEATLLELLFLRDERKRESRRIVVANTLFQHPVGGSA